MSLSSNKKLIWFFSYGMIICLLVLYIVTYLVPVGASQEMPSKVMLIDGTIYGTDENKTVYVYAPQTITSNNPRTYSYGTVVMQYPVYTWSDGFSSSAKMHLQSTSPFTLIKGNYTFEPLGASYVEDYTFNLSFGTVDNVNGFNPYSLAPAPINHASDGFSTVVYGRNLDNDSIFCAATNNNLTFINDNMFYVDDHTVLWLYDINTKTWDQLDTSNVSSVSGRTFVWAFTFLWYGRGNLQATCNSFGAQSINYGSYKSHGGGHGFGDKWFPTLGWWTTESTLAKSVSVNYNYFLMWDPITDITPTPTPGGSSGQYPEPFNSAYSAFMASSYADSYVLLDMVCGDPSATYDVVNNRSLVLLICAPVNTYNGFVPYMEYTGGYNYVKYAPSASSSSPYVISHIRYYVEGGGSFSAGDLQLLSTTYIDNWHSTSRYYVNSGWESDPYGCAWFRAQHCAVSDCWYKSCSGWNASGDIEYPYSTQLIGWSTTDPSVPVATPTPTPYPTATPTPTVTPTPEPTATPTPGPTSTPIPTPGNTVYVITPTDIPPTPYIPVTIPTNRPNLPDLTGNDTDSIIDNGQGAISLYTVHGLLATAFGFIPSELQFLIWFLVFMLIILATIKLILHFGG